jgi:energy-coupling factor transporter ATP-binding protein EcfA2
VTDESAAPDQELDLSIVLPGGDSVPGTSPVVIIGPNGSGKTRQARQLQTLNGVPISFVNALRNTRVTTEIPAIGLANARNNLTSQDNQARTHYWEQVNDFDMLLARLHGEDAAAAISSRDAMRRGERDDFALSSMERIQALWARLFPGRELSWNDNVPMVRSTIDGSEASYQGHYMSDGEKSALYLAGKVALAPSGILVIDEPETHFHTLLAVELWTELEASRPDVRIVYITHDLTFALSRRHAAFVLASPGQPMRILENVQELPPEAADALLGAASFSFYARRLVLCEGNLDGIDHSFYRSWFDDVHTVVRPVGSSEMVIRSVAILNQADFIRGIEPTGIIDRDFHSDAMLAGLPHGVTALPVHEVESLYCIVGVVAAVAKHVGRPFDEGVYMTRIRATIDDVGRHAVVIERWKRTIEGPLLDLVGQVATRPDDLDTSVEAIPTIFDHATWTFSPKDLLVAEKTRVELCVPDGLIDDVLRLMPGKAFLAAAASTAGLRKDDYIRLINQALAGTPGLEVLATELVAALATRLPHRTSQPEALPVT